MKKSFFLSLRPWIRTIFLLSCLAFLSQGRGLTAAVQKKLIQGTPSEQRLKWFEDHTAMKKGSPTKDLRWTFIGPDIISGRVTDVAVHPKRKRTIFVASASGGVWKTDNAGTTWNPVLENVPAASVGDVTLAPSNPDTVWVGLGESNILRSSVSGAGLYKSMDAGRTWEFMGLAGTQTVARIVIHPGNPDIVYVAASGNEWTFNPERGVYRTANGGKTWDKVLYVDDQTGAIDLAMDPSDSNTLYAATWQRIRRRWSDPQNKPGYSGSGIHKTTDGGKTWQPINEGLPKAELRGRIGLDVSRSNPNVLYATVRNHTPRAKASDEWPPDYKAAEASRQEVIGAEIYRSENKGRTWVKVSPPFDVFHKLLMYENINWFGWVFGQIRVDPNDENTVYTLGVNFLKSKDGGKNWNKVEYPGVHVDHHALWIDPDDSNYMVNGNDGGLNISYDGGKTWLNFHSSLPVAQFYSVAVDMRTPFWVYGSPQDHGCLRGPVTSRPGEARPGQEVRQQWEMVPGGEYQVVAVDPTNPAIYYSGGLGRSVYTNGKWETKNSRPKREKGDPPLRSQSLTPFILSPHNPTIIYLGMQFLYRSLDSGATWEKISPDLTAFNPQQQDDVSFASITSISESPLKFGVVYAGTDDGRVHVTRDSGAAWTEITGDLPFNKHVSRLTASAYQAGTVFLSLNGMRDDDFADYLFKSTDYGKTWTDISANIPGGPVNVIREDPKNENVLYVGTDIGVYVTMDAGRSWHVLGGNLPTVYVHDLVVHPRDGILVIATHGRGMWTVDVSSLQKK